MEVTPVQFAMALTSAFLVGFSKGGMPGLGVLLVPLMGMAVGSAEAPGVLLPVLILGDIFAVARYHGHIRWRIVLRLLPYVVVGLVFGSTVLQHLRNETMDLVMGLMVIGLVSLQVLRRTRGGWLEERMPHAWWFALVMGLLAGFATGLAHLAGPVMTVYFLSMDLKKHGFIGSAAIFFMIVNLAKIPLYIPQGNITWPQAVFAVKILAAVPVGALAGFLLFNHIPQRLFNRFVLVLAAAAGLKLVWPHVAALLG